jgi:manganese-dependent inorganic pyrophosphatase
MLAAVLSDTVILQSPTTTSLDREMGQWLAELAGVELEAFGRENDVIRRLTGE